MFIWHPCWTGDQGGTNSVWFALQFEGRHIRVDLAAGVSKSIRGGGKNVLYDSGKSVFLGNLPFDVVVSTPPPLADFCHSEAHRDGELSLCSPPIWLAGWSKMAMTAFTMCHHLCSMGKMLRVFICSRGSQLSGQDLRARRADTRPKVSIHWSTYPMSICGGMCQCWGKNWARTAAT